MKRIPFLLVLIILSCGKDVENPGPNLSGDKRLISLSLSLPGLVSEARISGTNANAYMPIGLTLNNINLEFSISDNASAKWDGNPIISGSTVNLDLHHELVVTAEDGTSQTYEVNILTHLAGLDQKLQAAMMEHDAPGLQVAITYRERLVYINSYGFSDVDSETLTTNETKFRVASVSKAITAAAILKMIEENEIGWHSKVFGPDALLGEQFGTPPYENAKTQMTVGHLLEHQAGWGSEPFDPMFYDTTITQSDLISSMLDNAELAFSPGLGTKYSNFGYCVLGRIIEEVSGLSYEDYLLQEIFSPVGIINTRVGADEPQLPEATYYSQDDTLSAYGVNIGRMDSGGGLISTATDLANFITRMDRRGLKPDILTGASLQELGFGETTWTYYGVLPGSTAILSKKDSNINFVVATNTNTLPVNDLLFDLKEILDSEIENITHWPSYDLFEPIE